MKTNISGSKQRQINAVFTGIATRKLATLDAVAGDRLLGKLDLLRASVEPAIFAAIDELSFEVPPKLKLVKSNIELGAVPTHNPQEFYQTRKGLWVSGEFKSRVLSSAKPVSNLGPISLSSHDLTENLYDREIKTELPANHVFEVSEACARIEQMTAKQSGGEKGDLLTNGYANLFYVPGCVVGVRWSADSQEWRVFAWLLVVGFWDAGRRVFSCN